MLERTAGLEPTPPYGKYGALQSCVRKNHTLLIFLRYLTAGDTLGEALPLVYNATTVSIVRY